MQPLRQEDAVLRWHWMRSLEFRIALFALVLGISPDQRHGHSTLVSSAHAADVVPRKSQTYGNNPLVQIGFESVAPDADKVLIETEEPPFVDATQSTSGDYDNGYNFDEVRQLMGYEILPAGLMYRSYIAGEKEPRFQSMWLSETGRGRVWDTQMGGRIGLLRYGTPDAVNPQGWQLDMEGGAQTRVDPLNESDLESVDFRFGILSTWRFSRHSFKLGYYHLSSHIGDEYLLRNPTFQRNNYVRDSAIVGWTFDMTEDMSVYGEVGYAAGAEGGAKPLELQYGYQYTPLRAYGFRGAPFFGINGHTREDFSWISSVNTVAGWQWRGEQTNHLFRLGLQYYTGPAIQWEFAGQNETLCGAGLWFDY